MVQAFDSLVQEYDLLKMKTIGDSFMATAGLLQTDEESLHKSVRCGLEMISAARSLRAGWNLRVGIPLGPVIAGVVGQRQDTFTEVLLNSCRNPLENDNTKDLVAA